MPAYVHAYIPSLSFSRHIFVDLVKQRMLILHGETPHHTTETPAIITTLSKGNTDPRLERYLAAALFLAMLPAGEMWSVVTESPRFSNT